MDKPLLYDVYCGAGGAAKGYQRAGFRVIGIDNKFQPHYCGDGFILMDALEFLDRYNAGEFERAQAFHASPPCQGYGITHNIHTCKDKDYPLLIPDTRERLLATSRPLVIENVPGAPLQYSVMLCGLMFDLKVLRHRIFETNFHCMQPGHPYHRNIEIGKDGFCCVVAHSAVKGNSHYQYPNRKTIWQAAMLIDWMTKAEMTQAIPWVYTEFIGKYLMRATGR